MEVFDNSTFIEEINASNWNSNDYLGWGSYYANLVWVYCIKNDIKINDTELEENKVNYICKTLKIDSLQKESLCTIICECACKLSDLFYKIAFYCLKNRPNSTKKFSVFFENILSALGINDNGNFQDFDALYCAKYLEKSQKEIEKILNKLTSHTPVNEIFANIYAAINTFMGDSKLLPNYLLEDLNNNKIRCIAAYIFDQPHNFKDGYISFSGYNECEDMSIIKSVVKNSKYHHINTIFIQKLIDISNQLNLLLVITNSEICTYHLKNGTRTTQLDVSSNLQLELVQRSKSIDKIKDQYACSERKIFTAFYPNNALKCLPNKIAPYHSVNYYPGTLYVKYTPCSECALGIVYEHQKQHSFLVKSYLPKI